LAEISYNQYVAAPKQLPVTKSAKQPAKQSVKPKCWMVITLQDIEGNTSSSCLGKHQSAALS